MRKTRPPYVVTVDGLTASGKGTLVTRLAKKLDFYPVHIGMFFRMAGYFALKTQADFSENSLFEIAQQVVTYKDGDDIDHTELKSEATASLAVRVADHPNIMKFFDAHCRNLCRHPPQNKTGIIFDADHAGKVIAPDATVKLWLTAELETRAERRWKQLRAFEPALSLEDMKHLIANRDFARSHRPYAPMQKAKDACEIDTTNLTIESTYMRALTLIEAHIPL